MGFIVAFVRLFFLTCLISSHALGSDVLIIDDSPMRPFPGPFPALVTDSNQASNPTHWLDQAFLVENFPLTLQQGPNSSWYKIKLKGQFQDNQPKTRIIVAQTHVLRLLNFYLFENNTLIKRANLGVLDAHLWDDTTYKGPNFQFDIRNGQELTLLIEKQSNGPSVLPMIIYDPIEYKSHTRFQDAFWASIISILFAMVFFNVLIYAMHPSKAYLWYLAFHSTGFLYFAASNGFGFLFFPAPIQTWLIENIMFLGSMLVFFGLNFMEEFLEFKIYIKRFVNWILPLKVVALISAALNLVFFEYQTIAYFSVFQLIICVFAISMGVIAFRNGFNPAKYFIIAWTFPIFGGFIEIGVSMGAITASFLTLHGFVLGTMVELFLLSIALASRIKQAENQLLNQLYKYPDTELANFNYVRDILPHFYQEKRNELAHPFVLIADLHGFREVASLYGPNVLNELFKLHTQNIADFLSKQLWSVPLPMPNGEPFYLINLPSEQIMCIINLPKDGIDMTLSEVLSDIMNDSNGTLINKEYTSQIHITVGCAEIKDDIETAYRQAQVALLTCLKKRQKWMLFSHEHEKSIGEQTLILHELKQAIDNSELSTFIQPKLNLKNESFVGGEILLRWQHKDFGDFSPAQFIPLAEQSGMVFQITQLVITNTFEWLNQMNQQDLLTDDFHVSINLSALDMSEARLTSFIASRLEKYNIDAKWVTFEITESATQENPAQIIQTIGVLKLLGFRISIDDFGTGYSSMVYLQNLKPDEIKIDIAFIRGINKDTQKQHIVRAIVQLAQSSNAITVAEGIETEAELDQVIALHCNHGQGYLWDRALSLDEYEQKYLKST